MLLLQLGLDQVFAAGHTAEQIISRGIGLGSGHQGFLGDAAHGGHLIEPYEASGHRLAAGVAKERFIEAYDIEFCKWVESVHAGKLTGPSSWDGYVACVAGDALNASRGTSQFLKVETMEKPEMYK